VSPTVWQGLPRQQRALADVTVIGARPAGTFLAYLLATRGLQVILVEKVSLPRVKPYGGGLNQQVVSAALPTSSGSCTAIRIWCVGCSGYDVWGRFGATQ
jgi:heterodisulfide reductase subunit A-like polyferredoxin